ncbi:glycoside hydrolase family 2 TIM barrel-domain containing protein [Sinomonas sp. P47F7]|uniref:glycoside hydrolase family 2 TIM barrel-domain containing protein n=1 Tax=Sinomonas sp. P47F7 TaxID=3410987 RepID=UPI003BF5F1E1
MNEHAHGPVDTAGFTSVNRLPIHAVRRPADISLDGEWDFQLLPSPSAVPAGRWQTVQVPSLWTMSSQADRPFYTNVPMPFDEVPPAVPADNPVGVYRRVVDIQPQGRGRVILHVGAAEGRLSVAVNGRAVGTSTDSHLEAEFDITSAVGTGLNTIQLTVAKWSAVSYLEDQDQWWQSGLSRSVWISFVPEVRIADVVAKADYDHLARAGSLRLEVQTEGLAHRRESGHRVIVEVLRGFHDLQVAPRIAAPTLPKPSRQRDERPPQMLPDDFMDLLSIRAASAPVPPEFRAIPDMAGMAMAASAPAGTATLELSGLDVQPWSAERPHLYDVAVQLLGPGNRIVDTVSVRVGFRTVKVEGRDLLVNGKRVLIQGVARHDVDPRTGRVITGERMLEELSLLKRFNVNAIRTAHYPNDPAFLDLCDELGFYVVDEADVEGHAFASTIADDPSYLMPIIERVARMVLRDRNHPCVIAWSLGNETGFGAAHDAAAAWVRRFDSSRPVHYEGAIATDWHGGHGASDLVCPMYPSFAALEGYSADPRSNRPLILCEYAYSQGNSTGGLAEYWRLFESLPALQGGFIWEFTDHALDPDGDGRYRYGGDFGDATHNGATMLNGIAFADATPKPALFEARGLFSPVRIVSDANDARRGRLRVRSRRNFADLSDLAFELHVESRTGCGAAVPVDLADVQPGTELEIELPDAILNELRREGALAISLTVRTARPASWAPAGTELAVHQVVLPRTWLPLAASEEVVPPTLAEEGSVEHPLLVAPPRLSLWRALTDNDGSFALDQRFVRSGFFALEPIKVRIEDEPSAVLVSTWYRAAFGDEIEHRRRISRHGDTFRFEEHVELPGGTRDGLRVGVEFELDGQFDTASWVGLGPWENYPDRNTSALLGRWTIPIDDLAVPYVIPQENGTRGGVDTLELNGPSGVATIRSADPLHINVGRHTVQELEDAAHWWELPASTRTIVHLDIAHRGVGTGLLGPDTRPQHRLFGAHYTWTWELNLEAR